MYRIEDVLAQELCVGCGVCSAASRGAIPVRLDTSRMYRADIAGVPEEKVRVASSVCPFSDESPNEDSLGVPHPSALMTADDRIGFHTRVFAGRVSDDSYLSDSSSGGVASWLTNELLVRGQIDAVINVGRDSSDSSLLFSYGVTSKPSEPSRRKSQYYATTLAEVLEVVRANDGRFALVAIPCFMRAVRSLCAIDPDFAQRITVFVGLVCGHYKSQAFAESLAWQVGVDPGNLAEVDFRRKREDRPANRYDFAARAHDSDVWRSHTSSELVGGNWGHVAFQPKACNYCDDVVAETADVSIGDAWLPQYAADSRGTNLVISRNSSLDILFDSAAGAGAIKIFPLSADDAVRAQAGGFRYRRDGLAIRLADDAAAGKPSPQKRVVPATTGLRGRRARLIRHRARMAETSHIAFAEALRLQDLGRYTSAMHAEIAEYRRLDATLLRRVLRFGKSLLQRLRRVA